MPRVFTDLSGGRQPTKPCSLMLRRCAPTKVQRWLRTISRFCRLLSSSYTAWTSPLSFSNSLAVAARAAAPPRDAGEGAVRVGSGSFSAKQLIKDRVASSSSSLPEPKSLVVRAAIAADVGGQVWS